MFLKIMLQRKRADSIPIFKPISVSRAGKYEAKVGLRSAQRERVETF